MTWFMRFIQPNNAISSNIIQNSFTLLDHRTIMSINTMKKHWNIQCLAIPNNSVVLGVATVARKLKPIINSIIQFSQRICR